MGGGSIPERAHAPRAEGGAGARATAALDDDDDEEEEAPLVMKHTTVCGLLLQAGRVVVAKQLRAGPAPGRARCRRCGIGLLLAELVLAAPCVMERCIRVMAGAPA